MTTMTSGMVSHIHEFAPLSFDTGFIALSYFVSFVGSLSTLELLQRMTSGRGLYNWYLLIGSAMTMGGVAIFCMHFVGLRALVLYSGEPHLQLSYNPGYTAISFFLPILVLLGAYSIASAEEHVNKTRVGLSGLFAGFSICGMHYCGQAGIANYACVYSIPFVVGSVAIAVIATVAALWLFFVWREKFINSWWKRIGCAACLAGAVSGMHWTASVGTSYRFRTEATEATLSRNTVVIITIVLSVTTCVVLLAFAVFASGRTWNHRRVRRVVLTAATFDHSGRLMVLPDGTLPSRTITNQKFQECDFEECFAKSHPVFHWIYRTSRNWGTIAEYVLEMRSHLRVYAPPSVESESSQNSSIIVRELFCTAAADLADAMHQPLEDLGSLFEDIVLTRSPGSRLLRLLRVQDPEEFSSLEAGHGMVLFLVKRVDKAEASRLSSYGFRFTDLTPVICGLLSQSMQVCGEIVADKMATMAQYARNSAPLLNPGVHVGCFAIRATVGGNFDVLVRRDAKNLLPTAPLLINSLSPAQSHFLDGHDGKTVDEILDGFAAHIAQLSSSPDPGTVGELILRFHKALMFLKGELADPFFGKACLIAHPQSLPGTSSANSARSFEEPIQPAYLNNASPVTLISFQAVINIHSRTVSTDKFVFSPLKFFSVQQGCHPSSAEYERYHEAHGRDIYREFAGRTANALKRSSLQTQPLSRCWKPWIGGRTGKKCSTNSISSHKSLMLDSTPFTAAGIMVSQSVSIDVVAAQSIIEMKEMGPSTKVKVDNAETWADVLFKESMSKKKKPYTWSAPKDL